MADLNLNTLTSLPNEVKTFYDKQLIKVAEPLCAYRRHAQKTKLPQNEGKTVNWRDMKKLDIITSSLTEGVTPDGQGLVIDKVEATVRPFGGYVAITDHVKLTAIDDVLMHANKRLGLQAAESLDHLAGTAFCGGNNVVYSGGAASRAALANAKGVLSLADILGAAQFLKTMAAPKIDNSYWGIVHPAAAFDLMKAAEINGSWVEVSKYADPKNMIEGEIGKIFGVRFIESPNAITVDESGTTVYQTLIYGDDAFGCVDLTGGNLRTIIKPIGSGGTSDPLDTVGTAGWKAWDACAILNNDFLIRIESCSNFGGVVAA